MIIKKVLIHPFKVMKDNWFLVSKAVPTIAGMHKIFISIGGKIIGYIHTS